MLSCLLSSSQCNVGLCRERAEIVRRVLLMLSPQHKRSRGARHDNGKHPVWGREPGKKRRGTRREAGPMVEGAKALHLSSRQK